MDTQALFYLESTRGNRVGLFATPELAEQFRSLLPARHAEYLTEVMGRDSSEPLPLLPIYRQY